MEWVDVAAVEALSPGNHVVVDVDGVEVAVFNVAGRILAVEDRCSHDGGCLAGGALDGEDIVCPRHGARFSLVTGTALTAPAYEPIAVFPTRVDNGTIQVRDARWD